MTDDVTHDVTHLPPTAGPSQASLLPTAIVDCDHPAVRAFAREHARGVDERACAVSLFYAVRDGFRYDPYRAADLTLTGVRASSVLEVKAGWCVTKATLLTAACRAAGIPARMGFADVFNHLSTERMRQAMQTEVFVWHGFSEIWLDGAWRKATPAFNIDLCEKFGLLPLEFDGVDDSLYQPFDRSGHRHMEYLRYHGSFDDVPLKRILADFVRVYPGWRAAAEQLTTPNFDRDVSRETQT